VQHFRQTGNARLCIHHLLKKPPKEIKSNIKIEFFSMILKIYIEIEKKFKPIIIYTNRFMIFICKYI
jgi:hypothetical protein